MTTYVSAEELMIGDWVMVRDFPIRYEPKQVKPEHFIRSLCEFRALPLTEEILSKNFPEYEEGYTIGWWPESDGSNSEVDNNNCFHIEFVGENCEVCVSHVYYVHQLQHILRICGLSGNIRIE